MSETNPPSSLGEFLRNEREKRGLSVDQVASATKIGVKILYALEADRFDELPALPFVRGFVKNYAKFVGLSAEQVLRDYDEFLHSRMKARPDRSRGHSGYAFERPEGEQSRQMLWAIMGTMIVLGGLVILVFKPSLKHRHHGHVEKMQAGNATPSPTPVAEASPVPSSSPVLGASPVAVAAAPSPSPIPSASAVAVATPSPAAPVEAFVPPKTPLVLAPKEAPAPSPAPSPAAVVVATPLPVPPPAPSPVAPPAPAPTVAVAPTPAPSTAPTAEPSPKADPLQSGVDYAPKDIKHKIIVKALEDVWVRYRCDDKEVMRFRLRKDRILVLRGKTIVRFQASNPESVTLGVNYREPIGMQAVRGVKEVNGTSTIQFGSQPGENAEDIFSKESQLPAASD